MPAVANRPRLRERQRQETHLLIRRTAVELTLERGVGAVSVHDICDAAGVSSRTFFNHFRSKDEALIPDFPDFSLEAQREFVERAEPELVPALERLLCGYVAWLKEETDRSVGPEAVHRLLEANPELLPRILAAFEAHERVIAELVGRRTGRRSDDLFCVVAALVATATLRAAVAVVKRTPGAADSDPTAGDPPAKIRPEQLEATIKEAFSVLHELATP